LRAAVPTLIAVVLLAACGSSEEASSPPLTAVVTVAPPPSGPTEEQLPALAVGLSDLPDAFTVRREGYLQVSSEGVVGEFRRFFDPGDTALGDSRLVDLSSDVALFRDEETAQAAIGGILAALLGDQVEAAFADLVMHAVGIEATNIEGQTLATRELGESGVVAQARFDTSAGRAEAVYVVVQVGSLHHALFLIGSPGQVKVDDARELARAVIPRLQQASGSAFAA
jgi:hypothetical protein